MPRASDNYTGLRISKLRKPELIRSSPRQPTKGERHRGYDRVIRTPWDIDAVPGGPNGDGTKRGEKDLYLLPPAELSEEARLLREGDDPVAYNRQVSIWRDEVSEYSTEVQEAVLGKQGKPDTQPFDPDVRCFLLLKIVEYCELHPDDTKGDLRAKTDFKRAVWEKVFVHCPDVDPLNREFPEKMAVAAYLDALNAKFSSRVRSVLGVQDKKPVRVHAHLDHLITGHAKSAANPVRIWASQADKATNNLINAAFTEVVEEWHKRYPDAKIVHNRPQLTYQAQLGVYERLALEDKGFSARWEAEASRREQYTEEERKKYNVQMLGTVNYAASRAAELTGTTYVVIAVGKFKDGTPNTYIEQHGLPRGRRMASHNKTSPWAQAILPLVSGHVQLGYGIDNGMKPLDLEVGHGIPNVHIEDVNQNGTSQFAPPQNFDLALFPTSIKDPKVAVHQYFSQHIAKLWGLKSIPWGAKTTKYFQGPPDRHTYANYGPLFNGNMEQVRDYMVLENPLTHMSKDDALIWVKHIRGSEDSEVPEAEALRFIGKDGAIFPVYGARKRGAVEDFGKGAPAASSSKRKRSSDKGKDKKKKQRALSDLGSEEESSDFSLASDNDNMSEDSEDLVLHALETEYTRI